MNKLFNYFPFHFLIGLIFGIVLQYNYNICKSNPILLLVVLASLITLLIISHKLARKTIFNITSFFCYVLIGVFSVFIRNEKNYDNYYEKIVHDNSHCVIKISKKLKPNNYYYKYNAKVFQVDSKKTIGNILVSIKKDSIKPQVNIGDYLLVSANFKNVNPPLNPHQFNYRKYLAQKGIYKQLTLNPKEYEIIRNNSFSINKFSERTKKLVQRKLTEYPFSSEELSVINALVLGQRKEISKDLSENYANAGVAHILAISGLHIGIILLILSWMFKPLEKFKKGEIVKTLLIVFLLWMFAFITGFSASVVRAVTMFSFVIIGKMFNRKKIIEHSLITSALLLLLIKPMFIFDIGFQLSYLAVFSIVWIQPLLYQLWQPKLIITNYFWKLISVSIAVQIGITPVSLYYFHQFPSLFLCSNLIIIPVLGIILFSGISIIALAILNFLPKFLAELYGSIISFMNNFIRWIAHQEGFLFKQIYMSLPLMTGWYLVIILGYQFYIRRNIKSLIYFCVSIILLQSLLIYEKHLFNSKREFIVFHKNRNSIFGNRNGNTLQVFSDLDSSILKKERFINDYITYEKIETQNSLKKHNIFKHENDTILVIDSLGIYNIKIKNPIIILRKSPKINLNRVIEKLHPKKIIVDGSNYNSYRNRWKKTCIKTKTPFYQTKENGAFILSN